MEIADFASESIIIYDLHGIVKYCNPASELLYGWFRAAMVGRSLKSLTASEHLSDSVWPQLRAVGSWSGTITRKSLAGSDVKVNARFFIRRDQTGIPLDVVEYSTPAVVETLSGAEEPVAVTGGPGRAACWQFNISQVSALLLSAANTQSIRDVEWQQNWTDRLLSNVSIMDVNDEAKRLFDLDLDHRTGTRPITNLWPEATHPFLASLITAIASKTDSEPEVRNLDGAGRLTNLTLTGWRSAEERCPDIVFVYISAQENAPKAVLELEASQRRYRNIFSSLPVPVWHIDIRAMGRVFDRIRASGVSDMASYSLEHPEIVELARQTVVVSDVNNEAAALFGAKDRSELLGPIDYLFAESPAVGRRMMLAHFEGIRNYVEELKVRTKDGRLIDVLLLCTFPVPGERLDTSIMMAIDINERVKTEAKLRQVESDFTHAARLSTLGELTASIAHEIKQPLSAILMNAQTTLRYLTRPDPNIEKACLLISRVIDSSQRANDIIGRIREMAGKHLPTREEININDVVRDCLLFLRHETDDQAVNIQMSLEDDLPPILGDKVQLQQIVVNLIVNSLQAMKEGPRNIVVKTWWHDVDGVVCSIEDSGTGIEESHIGQIFDGFFTTKSDGIGIGLAICQSIARAHGGEIIATNAVGRGAVFRFNIPAYLDEVEEREVGAIRR